MNSEIPLVNWQENFNDIIQRNENELIKLHTRNPQAFVPKLFAKMSFYFLQQKNKKMISYLFNFIGKGKQHHNYLNTLLKEITNNKRYLVLKLFLAQNLPQVIAQTPSEEYGETLRLLCQHKFNILPLLPHIQINCLPQTDILSLLTLNVEQANFEVIATLAEQQAHFTYPPKQEQEKQWYNLLKRLINRLSYEQEQEQKEIVSHCFKLLLNKNTLSNNTLYKLYDYSLVCHKKTNIYLFFAEIAPQIIELFNIDHLSKKHYLGSFSLTQYSTLDLLCYLVNNQFDLKGYLNKERPNLPSETHFVDTFITNVISNSKFTLTQVSLLDFPLELACIFEYFLARYLKKHDSYTYLTQCPEWQKPYVVTLLV